MRAFRWPGPLLLAACGAAATAPEPAPGRLIPDAGGLGIEGSALRVDFGRAEAGAVAAVAKLLGAPPTGRETRTDCSTGTARVVRFRGIDLIFAGGGFRGWASNDPGIVTANGLRQAGATCPDPAGG